MRASGTVSWHSWRPPNQIFCRALHRPGALLSQQKLAASLRAIPFQQLYIIPVLSSLQPRHAGMAMEAVILNMPGFEWASCASWHMHVVQPAGDESAQEKC